MKEFYRKSREFVSAVAIPASDYCTNLTKGIHFKANTVSRAMDAASGGYLKHGGLHRLYGGHDISNFAYWKRHGVKYPQELAKDFLTKNGLPYPKLEIAVKKGWIKASTAQKWGTWNIGKLGAASLGVIDSGFTVKRFAKNRSKFDECWKSTTFKGAVKLSTGISTGNVPLAVAGAVDLSLTAYSQVESRLQFEYEPDFRFAASFI